MYRCIYGWISGCIGVYTDGYLDVYVHIWIAGYVNVFMDGYLDV